MTSTTRTANPRYAQRKRARTRPAGLPPEGSRYCMLPLAPVTASPVPRLTSLYHFDCATRWGDRSYPGNCGGGLISDLLRFFRPRRVFDPMTGSGTCRDACRDLDIECVASDLREGRDACDPSTLPVQPYDFCWLHPPYWRQKLYTADPRDLSRATSLPEFLARYEALLATCASGLAPGGRLAVLMGDYHDRAAGFVPLVYHTKRLAFELGLHQAGTDIIRFSHGTTSSRKVYRTSFIPGLHDVCMVFEKQHTEAPPAEGKGRVRPHRPPTIPLQDR